MVGLMDDILHDFITVVIVVVVVDDNHLDAVEVYHVLGLSWLVPRPKLRGWWNHYASIFGSGPLLRQHFATK